MIPWRRGIGRWIVLANGALAGMTLWFFLDRSFHYPAVGVDAGPTATEAYQDPPAAPVLDAFRSRPLFLASRSPPQQDEANAQEQAPPPPPVLTGYRLTGVILAGGEKIALVQPMGSDKATSVPVGGSVQGWELIEVGAGQATFKSGDNRTTLSFVATGGTGNGSP